MKALERRALATVQARHMLNIRDGVVLGLSGGADSVALLSVLLALRPLFDLRLYAVHVHHGLRGTDADADEAFCRELCERMNVTYLCEHVNAAAFARENGLTVEEAGRELRYAAFEAARAAWDAQKIAVAHHMNDNAETVLMRLLRGTGVSGLGGIPPVRGAVIRPLIEIPRADIEAYCAAKGLASCVDATNADERFTRNKLRHVVLPMLAREVNPAVLQALARTAQLAEEENEVLDMLAAQAYEDCLYAEGLSIAALSVHPAAIQRRVLRRALEVRMGLKDVHMTHVDEALALCGGQTGRQVSLPKGWTAARSYDLLCFTRATAEVGGAFEAVLLAGGEVLLPVSGQAVTLSMAEEMRKNAIKVCTKRVDYDKIEHGLVVRPRREGDVIVLPGGTKKLKKHWIDSKTPREAREKAVLVCDGANVVWIVGGALSAAYAADAGTKHTAYLELWEADK